MKKKNFVVTETMQKVAVDILESLTFCKNMDEVVELYQLMFEKYQLNNDPFTKLPCTNKEYAENSLEYQRQIMIERYGHCDVLD